MNIELETATEIKRNEKDFMTEDNFCEIDCYASSSEETHSKAITGVGFVNGSS